MTTQASYTETPDDRTERLYQELVDAIKELDKDPLTTHEWSDVANGAYWQSGIDNDDLLRALKSNLTASRQGLGFVRDIYMILDKECVEDISSILNGTTLTAAEDIQIAKRCKPSELMEQGSILGNKTRALIHYALTSPDCAKVTSIICERKPYNVGVLAGIMEERERITAPLRNGAL